MKTMRNKLFSVLLAVVFFASCGSKTPEYKESLIVDTEPIQGLSYDRYEDVLFHLDTANFQQELKSIQSQYRPFLEGDLDDPDAVRYLKSFAVDPISVELYQKVKQAFPDLDAVKVVVEGVYRHFHYYYPEIPLPSRIYTCVSGVNPDIPPVLFSGDALVISLDWYLDDDVIYERMGIPQYRSRRTMVESLSKDLGLLLYETYVDKGAKHNNLLEEMVEVGRMDFFVEAMCPEIADSVLLGYSSAQMEWVEVNEGNIWADMVGSQCLYSADLEVYRVFLSDGPFTNEYSHDAPSRLGEYIGLQIVRSYISSHDLTLQELMAVNDLQGLFLDSRYKPKK